ncbi:MAG TPA: hypothetical protein VGW38_06185 [Chloroflexota bacterium]|nr:hypothetical protein [Chloroflexota bacterium]
MTAGEKIAQSGSFGPETGFFNSLSSSGTQQDIGICQAHEN